MKKPKLKRVIRDRKLTPAEARKYARLRKQIADEIRPGSKSASARGAIRQGDLWELRAAVQRLRKEREAQGLSLEEIHQRSGLPLRRLAELEDGTIAIPDLTTISRYAQAVGKRLRLSLVSRPV